MKKKSCYKLQLTEDEFIAYEDKTIKELKDKFVFVETSTKKIENLEKQQILRYKIACKKFLKAYIDLKNRKININSYSLRKEHHISYNTSIKLLPHIKQIETKIELIKNTFRKKDGWKDERFKTLNELFKNLNFDDIDLYFYYYEEIKKDSNEFDYLLSAE